MNPLNYATLEASKRLADAGIVLETDFCWAEIINFGYVLRPRKQWKNSIPAPSMAEVWRELPEEIEVIDDGPYGIRFFKSEGSNFAGYYDYAAGYMMVEKDNVNLTDALIDLLIWVKRERK